MSTLRVGTLSNAGGTQSTSAENVINGCAKAWVNFNGTGTVAIRAQYNVSSITDNGVGDYTVNFTTAFANTNYAIVASRGYDFGLNADQPILFEYHPSRAASSVRVLSVWGNSAALNDPISAMVAAFG
jgi:hypothetical protein